MSSPLASHSVDSAKSCQDTVQVGVYSARQKTQMCLVWKRSEQVWTRTDQAPKIGLKDDLSRRNKWFYVWLRTVSASEAQGVSQQEFIQKRQQCVVERSYPHRLMCRCALFQKPNVDKSSSSSSSPPSSPSSSSSSWNYSCFNSISSSGIFSPTSK